MPRPLQFRGRTMIWAPIFALAMALTLIAWYSFFLTPLQRLYLVPFAWNQMQDGPGGAGLAGPVWTVFKTAPKRKPELAHDGDVVSATPAGTAIGSPALPMTLSPKAEAEGWTGLTLTRQIFAPHQYGPFLEEEFFDGKGVGRWMLSPLLFGAAAFLLLYGSREAGLPNRRRGASRPKDQGAGARLRTAMEVARQS